MATWMSCAAAFVSDSSQSAICARPAPLCSKIRCPTISSLSPVSTTSCLSLAQSTPANHCRRVVSVIWLLPPFLAKPSRSLSVPVLALEGAVFPLDIDRYQFAGARLRKRCSKHGHDVVTPGESAGLWKTTPVGARVAGHASFRCASLRMTCDDAVFPKTALERYRDDGWTRVDKTLRKRHRATAVGCLLDAIDQAVQV